MSLTISEVEHMTKAQRDAQLMSLFVTLNGDTMTDEEKRFFESMSQEQRDVAILDAITTLNGGTLTSSDKRFIEKKSEGQREALIWEAASEITTGAPADPDYKPFISTAQTDLAADVVDKVAGAIVKVSATGLFYLADGAAGSTNLSGNPIVGGEILSDVFTTVGQMVSDAAPIANGTIFKATGETSLQSGFYRVDGGGTISAISIVEAADFSALTTIGDYLTDGAPDGLIGRTADDGALWIFSGANPFALAMITEDSVFPAAAWVEFMSQAYSTGSSVGRNVDLHAFGVSLPIPDTIGIWVELCASSGGDPIYLDLSGGSCSTAIVDALLALFDDTRFDSVTIIVNGGTMGIPTGGNANANVVAIRGRGSIATINT